MQTTSAALATLATKENELSQTAQVTQFNTSTFKFLLLFNEIVVFFKLIK